MEALGHVHREAMKAALLQPDVEELFAREAEAVGKALSLNEAIDLGATDGVFFSHYHFPRTVRQISPEFHYLLWNALTNPLYRLLLFQVFRGGAKTTLARIFTAWEISYYFANTIVYLGKSEDHAKRSAGWVQRQITRQTPWARAYGLGKGSQWQALEFEIYHGLFDQHIWVVATGIEGSIRGINIDDYRPDFILLDDVLTEDNSSTPDQCSKMEDLILGSVKQSLAPASERPNAKMLMLQTPLNKLDASMKAKADAEWHSVTVSCFTEESKDLTPDEQRSAWPERWSDATLKREKLFAVRRNKLSLWLREMECKLVDPETCAFKEDWWQYYARDEAEANLTGRKVILESRGKTVLVIDPTPPPSDIQIAKGLRDKDYECLMVVRRGVEVPVKYYCVDYRTNKGHDPNWTLAMFWELVWQNNPTQIIVESVAYQRTLKWLIEEDMKRKGRYLPVKDRPKAKRSKYDKIVDPLNGPLSQRACYIHESHTMLKQQGTEFPNIVHEDVLECFAMGVEELSTGIIIEGDYETVDPNIQPPLLGYRGAP